MRTLLLRRRGQVGIPQTTYIAEISINTSLQVPFEDCPSYGLRCPSGVIRTKHALADKRRHSERQLPQQLKLQQSMISQRNDLGLYTYSRACVY